MFCAKFVAQRQSEACKLLKQLEAVGSIDSQVALLLFRQCWSFCRLVHLSRSTPPPLVKEVFAMFDDCVQQCTAVDASASTWQQAQLSLKKGGLGLRRLSCHSPAAYKLHFSLQASPRCQVSICPLQSTFITV